MMLILQSAERMVVSEELSCGEFAGVPKLVPSLFLFLFFLFCFSRKEKTFHWNFDSGEERKTNLLLSLEFGKKISSGWDVLRRRNKKEICFHSHAWAATASP